jgi:hypothetical protein
VKFSKRFVVGRKIDSILIQLGFMEFEAWQCHNNDINYVIKCEKHDKIINNNAFFSTP